MDQGLHLAVSIPYGGYHDNDDCDECQFGCGMNLLLQHKEIVQKFLHK
jgi:hypothetical protein